MAFPLTLVPKTVRNLNRAESEQCTDYKTKSDLMRQMYYNLKVTSSFRKSTEVRQTRLVNGSRSDLPSDMFAIVWCVRRP